MLESSYEQAPRREAHAGVRARAPASGAVERVWLRLGADGEDRLIEYPGEPAAGKGYDRYEALRSLQSALAGRRVLECCGNCCFFQLTGMSRDMSDGESGYCLVNYPRYGRSGDDVVAIFDYCDGFVHCEAPASDQVRIRLWKERARDTHGH